MPDAWTALSLYESTDLVSEFFEAKHGHAPAPNKAGDLVSHFAQARGYFSAAETADLLVRPLLLYYGAVALSRGLLLFTDPSANTVLRGSHGLSVVGWEQSLARGGSGVAELAVRSTGGTFTDLASRIANSHPVRVYFEAERLLPEPGVWTPNLPLGPEPWRFVFRDVLARVPDLWRTFERTTGEASDALPVEIKVSRDQQRFTFEVFPRGLGRTLAADELRRRFGLPEDTDVEDGEQPGPFSKGRFLRFMIGKPSPQANVMLPDPVSDAEGATFLVTPLPDGTVLSPLLAIYVVAYMMGMLVRYFPGVWMALIGRRAGDRMFPLLREATSLVSERFPQLLVRQLE